MKARLMRFSLSFPPFIGGLENHVYNISKYQEKMDFDVTVVIPKIPAKYEASFAVKKLPVSPMVPTAGTSLFKKILVIPIAFSFIFIGTIFGFLNRRRIDVYYLHGDWTMAIMGALLKLLTKKPSVITIHADYKGGIRRLSRRLFRFPFKFLDLIIAVSPYIKRSLSDDGIRTPIIVESSGIELLASSVEIPQKIANSVLFVGRIRPMKGVEYLVDAAPLIIGSKPDTNFYLVGDGPSLAKVKMRAKKSRVDDRFSFMGAIPNSTVREMYQKYSVFVLPSISTNLETEGTSTSILEAMAANIPIVTTKIAAMAFPTEIRKQMFVVDQKNHTFLAEGILSALNAPPEEIAAKTKIMREWVQQKSWEKVSERISAAILKLLQDKYSSNDPENARCV